MTLHVSLRDVTHTARETERRGLPCNTHAHVYAHAHTRSHVRAKQTMAGQQRHVADYERARPRATYTTVKKNRRRPRDGVTHVRVSMPPPPARQPVRSPAPPSIGITRQRRSRREISLLPTSLTDRPVYPSHHKTKTNKKPQVPCSRTF